MGDLLGFESLFVSALQAPVFATNMPVIFTAEVSFLVVHFLVALGAVHVRFLFRIPIWIVRPLHRFMASFTIEEVIP